MRCLAALVLVFSALAGAPSAAQTTVCSSLKIQASGAYFLARANCVGKALAKGLEPDALCIAKALTKLQKAFEKAEAKGTCASLSDLAPVEDVVADALDDGFDAVAAVGATCCDGSNDTCTFRSAQGCTDVGGTVGAAGSVCQADGTCGPFPGGTPGDCCDDIGDLLPELDGSCITGPRIGAICVNEGFPLVEGGTCHPEIGCVVASEPVRTRCTSAKLKAQGKFFSAVAKCQAKALKKSQPVELECLAKAESKLSKAFTAAEKKDDCLGRNDFSPALSVLNQARDLVVAILDPDTTYCCEGASGCFYTSTGPECSSNGGAPVGAGECDSDGTCKAPPLSEGGCCRGVPLGAIDRCVGGTTQVECTNLGGEYVGDALCLMGQVCID
jgi:hypothetical protein